MTAQAYDVLSYGTIGMDRIIRVPHLPSPSRSTHSSDESLVLGGKATNTASVLAHWGVSVAVSGTAIGDDEIGRSLFDALKNRPGISTEFIRRQPGLASMFCYIFVAQTGERVIVGMNTDDNPTTLPTVEMIRRCRVLTLDLYGGDERVEAARIAKSLGKTVIVGDVREADHPVLKYTDLAIASAAELETQGMEPREFSGKAIESGACNVIVTNGSKPVRVYGCDHSVGEIVPPEVEVVDTTGAGDAFRAGTVYAALHDMALLEGAALGTAVGSLIATARGATSRIPDLEITMNLARSLLHRRIRLSDSG